MVELLTDNQTTGRKAKKGMKQELSPNLLFEIPLNVSMSLGEEL
jgi:hypothetical protein